MYDLYEMYKQQEPRPRSITVSEARQAFADVVNRVAYGNERVTVARHGRDLVAIVAMSDVHLLEAIEADRSQAAAGRAAAAAGKASRPRRIEPRA
jgi:prevent-host-death family protein